MLYSSSIDSADTDCATSHNVRLLTRTTADYIQQIDRHLSVRRVKMFMLPGTLLHGGQTAPPGHNQEHSCALFFCDTTETSVACLANGCHEQDYFLSGQCQSVNCQHYPLIVVVPHPTDSAFWVNDVDGGRAIPASSYVRLIFLQGNKLAIETRELGPRLCCAAQKAFSPDDSGGAVNRQNSAVSS